MLYSLRTIKEREREREREGERCETTIRERIMFLKYSKVYTNRAHF